MAHNVQPRGTLNFASAETARVRWYEAAIAAYDERERRFRSLHEEEEMLRMRRPLTPEQAYARFGLLLGTLPPAAIFARALYTVGHGLDADSLILIAFCLAMNLLCALVGRRMGQRLGQKTFADAHASWPVLSLKSMWAALLWGLATGAVGGAVCFGFGAIPGALCALAVALPAFLMFAPLHHWLARGGMIDARHFWPVACGVTLTIATLILRLG
ncbi:MAG: hypothetical protein DMF64_07855 [Acidobacteria bacterium]|nr:MAG: hypothetical protein DMF64_07855 [Acidobacteriota bacterium]